MSAQHIARTYTDAEGVDHLMYEAQYATKGPASGKRWYVCHICGWGFREDQVTLKNGVAYCKRHGCYKDLL
jgi:hypothetical protein